MGWESAAGAEQVVPVPPVVPEAQTASAAGADGRAVPQPGTFEQPTQTSESNVADMLVASGHAHSEAARNMTLQEAMGKCAFVGAYVAEHGEEKGEQLLEEFRATNIADQLGEVEKPATSFLDALQPKKKPEIAPSSAAEKKRSPDESKTVGASKPEPAAKIYEPAPETRAKLETRTGEPPPLAATGVKASGHDRPPVTKVPDVPQRRQQLPGLEASRAAIEHHRQMINEETLPPPAPDDPQPAAEQASSVDETIPSLTEAVTAEDSPLADMADAGTDIGTPRLESVADKLLTRESREEQPPAPIIIQRFAEAIRSAVFVQEVTPLQAGESPAKRAQEASPVIEHAFPPDSPEAGVVTEVTERLMDATPEAQELAVPIIAELSSALQSLQVLQHEATASKRDIIEAVEAVHRHAVELMKVLRMPYGEEKAEAFLRVLLSPGLNLGQGTLLAPLTPEELATMGTREVKLDGQFAQFLQQTASSVQAPSSHWLGRLAVPPMALFDARRWELFAAPV